MNRVRQTRTVVTKINGIEHVPVHLTRPKIDSLLFCVSVGIERLMEWRMVREPKYYVASAIFGANCITIHMQ